MDNITAIMQHVNGFESEDKSALISDLLALMPVDVVEAVRQKMDNGLPLIS